MNFILFLFFFYLCRSPYLKLIMKSYCWLLQMEKGDNTDILKLQKRFIWLMFFTNLRKQTS